MAFRFFIGFVLCFTLGFTQNQDSISIEKEVIKDTLIDGHILLEKPIEAIEDSLSKKTLEDNLFAAKVDEKWFKELYDNNLFDTIYKSVTELTYEDVDYPELPTDTLKARLKALNTRTPFNVEYNPSLEIES